MPPVPVKGQTLSYDAIKEKLNKIPLAHLRESERFLAGDHWQGGDGWNGYRPDPEADVNGKTWLTIQNAFTPKNVSRGMVKRIEGAILGKQPDFNFTALDAAPIEDPEQEATRSKTEDESLFEQIDKWVLNWWDKREVHEKLKDFVFNKAAYGKAALRIYIPNGYLSEEGNLSGTFEEVLDKIYIDTPHYSKVVDDIDENYGEKYTILEVTQDQSKPSIFELCYIDPRTRETVLRQVVADENKNGTIGVETPSLNIDETGEIRDEENKNLIKIDLGGNLLTYIAGNYTDAMLSKTVKAQQKTVNMAKTGEALALNNINFPDTTFINADIPEKEIVKIGNQSVERRTKLAFGPGIWRLLTGVTQTDEQGNESVTTPDVKFRDGADPEKFAKVAENNTRDMHSEAGMLWIYLSSSPYPSGDSRVEAMTDYLILLVALKTLCDTIGIWLLTTVVRLALDFSGQASKKKSFKTIFSTKVTIGRISNEDKETMMKEVNMGARSLRNYMIVAETTDDPTGEVMAYLVERKKGLHENLESVQKIKEMDQQKEIAISAQKQMQQNGNGNGNGNRV